MILSYKHWRNGFLFFLGLFLGTAFCMKWLETGFYYKDSLFTIIGLEISYDAGRVMEILYNLQEPVSTLLRAHLYFDFVFMAGAYGGIACLCMMARYKTRRAWLRNLLLALACLQLAAWGCDIRENLFLLNWLSAKTDISSTFTTYHLVVIIKWCLAISGALLSIPLSLWKRKNGTEKSVF
jgi:hypothetical protein